MPCGCLTAEADLRYGRANPEQTMRRSNYREEKSSHLTGQRFAFLPADSEREGRRTKGTRKCGSGLTHGSLDPKERMSPSAGASAGSDDKQVSHRSPWALAGTCVTSPSPPWHGQPGIVSVPPDPPPHQYLTPWKNVQLCKMGSKGLEGLAPGSRILPGHIPGTRRHIGVAGIA